MEIADHNPQTMGKNKACYSAPQRITSIYARLARVAVPELPFKPAPARDVEAAQGFLPLRPGALVGTARTDRTGITRAAGEKH